MPPAHQREGCVESSLRLRRFHRFCSLQLAVSQCLRPERQSAKAMPISQTSSSMPQRTYAQPDTGGSTSREDTDRAGRYAQPRKPPVGNVPTGSGERVQQDAEGLRNPGHGRR